MSDSSELTVRDPLFEPDPVDPQIIYDDVFDYVHGRADGLKEVTLGLLRDNPGASIGVLGAMSEYHGPRHPDSPYAERAPKINALFTGIRENFYRPRVVRVVRPGARIVLTSLVDERPEWDSMPDAHDPSGRYGVPASHLSALHDLERRRSR